MYTILTTMIHLSAKETSPFSISIHLLVPIHHPAVPPVWFPPHRQPQDPGVQPCFVSAHCEETLSPRPLTYTLLGRLCGIFTSPGTKFIRPCLSPYSPSPLGLIIPCHHIAHFLPSSPFSRVYPPQGLTVFIAHSSCGMFLTTLVLPTCTIIPTCPARFQSQSSHPPT